jgi:3-dehydroquinate synthase
MKRLTVESERGAYDVIAEAGAVSRLADLLEEEDLTKPRSMVSDTTVGPLWGQPAAQSLDAPLIELADGEEHKRWPTVEGLLGKWLDAGLHRGDIVAAVGGGVLTAGRRLLAATAGGGRRRDPVDPARARAAGRDGRGHQDRLDR